MTITVLTWLWNQPNGRTQFTSAHVNIFAAMIRRHTTVPHRIACVTDMPEGIDSSITIIAPPREFEDVRIPTWGEERPQCLRRIAMFRPDAGQLFGDRFVCMDLDCVVANSLDEILTAPEDFRICKGTAKGRYYNGSIMLIKAGSRPQVYTKFTPKGAIEAGQNFLGSDQAWIAHCLGPREATFGLEDGVQMAMGWFNPNAPLTFYPGSIKPWDVVRLGGNAWAEKHYRDDHRGDGVYLGYGRTVWDDAARVFNERVGWVIASPEVAKVWNGPVRAVVRDDDEARRYAAMMGYDLTLCGETKEAA